MRQLTSLDAPFLAMENARAQVHVSVLGIYDPNTAFGRQLDAAQVEDAWPILDAMRVGLDELRDAAKAHAAQASPIPSRRKASPRKAATS